MFKTIIKHPMTGLTVVTAINVFGLWNLNKKINHELEVIDRRFISHERGLDSVQSDIHARGLKINNNIKAIQQEIKESKNNTSIKQK